MNNKNNLEIMAKYYNKHIENVSQHLSLCLHNINKADMEESYKKFYNDFPEFSVEECEEISKLLNVDYINYLKWMCNERD